MNLPWLASFLILLLLTPHALQAQCGGTCHWGALTTLPSGSSVTIPAGTTYCIAGSVANKTTGYVIDGTLIVQGGPDSLGAVTLGRTGAIDVEWGAKLVVSGTFTGDPTTPAPAISNVNVCGDLLVYPNPASTVLYLRVPTGRLLTSASLTDNSGRLIRQVPLPHKAAT